LWLHTPDDVVCSAWAGGVDRNPTDPQRYADAVETVLSGIQDGVSETLRDPWPRQETSRLEMAMPGARLVGDMLMIWYGREDAPVVRLRPPQIRELSSIVR
jgi:hypothetical protein